MVLANTSKITMASGLTQYTMRHDRFASVMRSSWQFAPTLDIGRECGSVMVSQRCSRRRRSPACHRAAKRSGSVSISPCNPAAVFHKSTWQIYVILAIILSHGKSVRCEFRDAFYCAFKSCSLYEGAGFASLNRASVTDATAAAVSPRFLQRRFLSVKLHKNRKINDLRLKAIALRAEGWRRFDSAT